MELKKEGQISGQTALSGTKGLWNYLRYHLLNKNLFPTILPFVAPVIANETLLWLNFS